MSKKLNTTAIQNELPGQSVFFKPSNKQDDKEINKQPVRSVRDVRNVRGVRGVRLPTKRERKRHPFDIYRDQLESLQRMKNEFGIQNGEIRTMSAMVREALDQYIRNNAKHK